jgi:hypothetical protein
MPFNFHLFAAHWDAADRGPPRCPRHERRCTARIPPRSPATQTRERDASSGSPSELLCHPCA